MALFPPPFDFSICKLVAPFNSLDHPVHQDCVERNCAYGLRLTFEAIGEDVNELANPLQEYSPFPNQRSGDCVWEAEHVSPSFLARDIRGRTVQRAEKQLAAPLLVGDASYSIAGLGHSGMIYFPLEMTPHVVLSAQQLHEYGYNWP